MQHVLRDFELPVFRLQRKWASVTYGPHEQEAAPAERGLCSQGGLALHPLPLPCLRPFLWATLALAPMPRRSGPATPHPSGEATSPYKLALQVPAPVVAQVPDEEAAEEVDEQDAGHSEEHVNDGQLEHLLEAWGGRGSVSPESQGHHTGPARPSLSMAGDHVPLIHTGSHGGSVFVHVDLDFQGQEDRDTQRSEPQETDLLGL